MLLFAFLMGMFLHSANDFCAQKLFTKSKLIETYLSSDKQKSGHPFFLPVNSLMPNAEYENRLRSIAINTNDSPLINTSFRIQDLKMSIFLDFITFFKGCLLFFLPVIYKILHLVVMFWVSPYFISSILLVVIILGLIYLLYKSKLVVNEKEKIIQQKEKVIAENNLKLKKLNLKVNDSFDEVIELAKKNDPAFLARFQEVYPQVYEKIIELEPKLAHTEVIFCAMVWLNFTSKDIARFTYIQPKTVQIKKYRLRKKLGIPKEEDLYEWLRSL